MPISERTLRRWRTESLKELYEIQNGSCRILIDRIGTIKDLHIRILTLTQELLDQHLLKGGKK